MAKEHLAKAHDVKNDEFYTQYADVVEGCHPYDEQLRRKTVLCNCDDFRKSNFVKYYKDNFHDIGLKRLISTTLTELYEFDGVTESVTPIADGGFGNADILNRADVIITNPPFSVFREFYKVVKSKQFLVIAPLLAISYVDVYEDFLQGKVKIGACKRTQLKFNQPDGTQKSVPIVWLTNLVTPYPAPMELKATYNPEIHVKYDDFNGYINVRKIKEIPSDYHDWMGIPITFLAHYNPAQFELKTIEHDLHIEGKSVFLRVFARLL